MTGWSSFAPDSRAVDDGHQVHAQEQGDEHQGRAVLKMTFQGLKKGCHSVLEKALFNSL